MGIMQMAVSPLALGTGIVTPPVPWKIDSYSGGGEARCTLSILTDGSFVWTGQRVIQRGSPSWYNPITVGVGSSYWVRLVPTATYDSGLSGSAVNTWLALSSIRSWDAVAPAGNNATVGATFNLQFATDAAGTTIVATMSGALMTAFSFYYENPGGF